LGRLLPETVKAFFTDVVVSVLGKGLILYFGIILWLRHFRPALRQHWYRWKDSKKIASQGCPERVTREFVFRYCADLQTSYGRVRYLEMLRLNQVPVEGAHVTVPELIQSDPVVNEELARVEEQWQRLVS